MSIIIEKKVDRSGILQLVSFTIGLEEFGVDILRVQEINKMIQITKVPNAPVYVEGIINLRGKVIPIIELRTKLGMPKVQRDKNTRIIVIEFQGNTIGFTVDSVKEVLRISESITEAPPSLILGVETKYITAVAKLEDRLLILLDLDEVFSQADKDQLMEIN